MRFQVPQFTDVEDKIIGPLTLKQFIYLGGAGGLCVVIYTFVPTGINFLLMVPVAILGGLLAFYKVGNKSFIEVIEAFFKYTISNNLYIWKKDSKPEKKSEIPKSPGENQDQEMETPAVTKNRLRELASNLDIQDTPTNDK